MSDYDEVFEDIDESEQDTTNTSEVLVAVLASSRPTHNGREETTKERLERLREERSLRNAIYDDLYLGDGRLD